jgi:hypothetical protein
MEESNESESLRNMEIDNLTLELLVNKNQYNKILLKTNPTKFKERQQYMKKILFFKDDILSIANHLIEHPEEPVAHDISQSFDEFVKKSIQYLETKNMKTHSQKQTEEDDDLTLFKTSSMEDTAGSLWGKKINKFNYLDS